MRTREQIEERFRAVLRADMGTKELTVEGILLLLEVALDCRDLLEQIEEHS
jgi:hypothetical protein